MSGRPEEFREFASERASPLHRSAYLLCGDWHLAHDLVQETLVKVYQHWPRVRQAENPDAYVRRMLLNEIRGRWRRRDQVVPVAAFPAEPTIPDATDDIARRDRLRQALLTLPLQQRATVVLRYFEGLTQRETAAALGCSEGTVKSQSSRALSTLRTFLDRTESKL
ncbi:MAG TPA: SigE family RNA polymerase sigma factor [Streptosporangiaceae bacterium]|nr:SigE family RNA polymerase sigma factor [Streptosporangiaceae bacterium]